MVDLYLTEHGEERVRERLGIPKRTVEKLAKRAMTEGAPMSAFTGSFKRYLDHQCIKFRSGNNTRIFHGYLWVFHDERLITVYPIPHKYRGVQPRIEKHDGQEADAR